MRWSLLRHLVFRSLLLGSAAWVVVLWLGLEERAAILTALALVTPSTGFIIASMDQLGASGHEQTWIKAKAIAAELLALAILFFVVQSNSADRFGLAIAALAGLVFAVPYIFRAYSRFIVPHAPGSEFGIIMVLGSIAAIITRYLGVYYLVGAFVVGFAGRRFGHSLGRKAFNRLVYSVENFAAFFIPFYFFFAGARVASHGFDAGAIPIAAAFLLVGVPLRFGGDVIQRMIMLGEQPRVSARIAVALMPTLVFTLVIAEILRVNFGISDALYGALNIYAIVTTILPSVFFRTPLMSLETPTIPHDDVTPVTATSVETPEPPSAQSKGG